MRLRLPLGGERRANRRSDTTPTALLWGPVSWSLGDDLARCAAWQIESDRGAFPDADIVVFHVPSMGRVPAKLPDQIWVAVSMESDVNYPALCDRDFMAPFDYTMTYRRDSDFPLHYVWDGLPDQLLRPPEHKDGDATAVYVASSGYNQSGRTDYVAELMRHIEVASYGRVLNNRSLDHDDGWNTKLAIIARYPFTLAFENSVTDDYVTEKFYQPLVAGSVPVYLGAPNVADFAPGEHCYVDVTDFDDPEELAAYLRGLVSRPDEYAAYLAWKEQPLRREFLNLVATQSPHPVCRLCRVVDRRLAERKTLR